MRSDERDTLVVVPTYNEVGNVETICSELLALDVALDLLFVDDNSPDGTGKILDGLAKRHDNVRVLHRVGRQGIGTAHRAGIDWAYDRNYRRLVTMDCDGAHPPQYLPDLLAAGSDANVVVGSRFLKSGSLPGWSLFRRCLTRAGHTLTYLLLGMSYDATGAFRLYDLTRIPRGAWDVVRSGGYSFFFESLYIFHVNRYTIAQIPIHLPARTQGHSKMHLGEMWRSLRLLFSIYFASLFNKRRFRIEAP
jgi:dolichol-phosphate mannosyltransferase